MTQCYLDLEYYMVLTYLLYDINICIIIRIGAYVTAQASLGNITNKAVMNSQMISFCRYTTNTLVQTSCGEINNICQIILIYRCSGNLHCQ